MTSQPSTQARALYSALTGRDYVTGQPNAKAAEFAPEFKANLELAEKFIGEHPEIKEAVEIIERDYADQIKALKKQAERYRLDRNNLANQLNDANAELGRESDIEYYD